MQKKLFIGIGLFVLLGGSALVVVATAGVPEPIDWGTPGTDAYYTSEPIEQSLPAIMANLVVAQKSTYVQIQATAVFRVGGPLTPDEAPTRFSDAEARLRDAFIMLISSKTPEDVLSAEQKELLKTEMKDKIQKIVFPDWHGRIEKILFLDFKVQ